MGHVRFVVPGVISGSACPASESATCRPPPGADVVLFLYHDNGDGTTPETVFWSPSGWAGSDGSPGRWGSLRDALWDGRDSGRMWVDDAGVAAMEAFFGPDPGLWLLASRVMGE